MCSDSSRSTPLPVLCLEDDELIGRALCRAIGGRDVELVTLAATARRRIAEAMFGAWILDVKLPDGSGLDVLAWARRTGRSTPALIVTGLDEHELANRAQQHGAEFLFKPYTKSSLDAFLERAQRATPVEHGRRIAVQLDLSERQTDVVMALARGVPRAELANELGIAETSVKTHVRAVLHHAKCATLDDLLREILRRAAS